MRYRIDINDGFVKSLSSSSRNGLIENVSEYLGGVEVDVEETDEGDMLIEVGGPSIGYIRAIS